MMTKPATVAVAMSGGVDSSVAALLMAREGRRVLGISMQLGNDGRFGAFTDSRCCSPRDLDDAAAAAQVIVASSNRTHIDEMLEDYHTRLLIASLTAASLVVETKAAEYNSRLALDAWRGVEV